MARARVRGLEWLRLRPGSADWHAARDQHRDIAVFRILHEALSNREYEVFLQIGAGKGVDQIARRLNLSPKTVRTYRSRILEKTDLKTTAEIIFYTINHGLVTEVVNQLDTGDEDKSGRPARPGVLPTRR